MEVYILPIAIFQRRNPRPTHACCPHADLRWHVKDVHVKDAAKGVVQDVAQDAEPDMPGAAEDGSRKVLILSIIIFQRWNPRPIHAHRLPRCPLATREGRAHEGCGGVTWRRTCHRTQLSGIWLGLWASASAGAAQSTSLFLCPPITHIARHLSAKKVSRDSPGCSLNTRVTRLFQ